MIHPRVPYFYRSYGFIEISPKPLVDSGGLDISRIDYDLGCQELGNLPIQFSLEIIFVINGKLPKFQNRI